ncbi:hypothetical protein MNBD_DELTA01-106 [hydrothermal vent metagenome]|uniref:Thioredoxin domain-containing protein n=1 Tax=hydrothermal vent metagenome TaxID=652676 RepID=A0A3B0QPX6_9ZZZZ
MIYFAEIIRSVRRSILVVSCIFILTGLSLPAQALAEVRSLQSSEEQAGGFGMVMSEERRLAPDFTLTDLEGKEHSLSDFKGEVVFLHFWATWCVPCRTEMPMLSELRSELEDAGLRIVAVAVDRGSVKWTKRTVGRFTKKHGVEVDVLLDHDNDLRRLYEVYMLPTTYIIGRDGRFTGRVIGGRRWNSAESQRFFRVILE